LFKLLARPFLCVITDDDLSDDLIVATVTSACASAPLVIQLRARNRSGRDLFNLAKRLRDATTAHESLLIVNDRLDIALAVRADGVHLPAAGIPPGIVRELVDRHARRGDRLLIGRSVHSVDEIRANSAFVDYFQFGPVFATPSKARYGPPQGVSALAGAVAASNDAERALIGVGGIDATNAGKVVAAGAAGVATIRAVMHASDAGAAALTLLDAITRRRA
jgi:thiamine-phosphate pyrophosphorylase